MFKLRYLLFPAAALFTTSCASSVKTLQITAEGGLAAASMQVDVVSESPAVQSVPVSEYFIPGNPVRAGASPRQTVRFGSDQPPTQTVSVAGFGKRAIVLAHLPGAHSDQSGDADTRRKTFSLSGKLPSGAKATPVVKVSVSPGGINFSPTQ